MAEWIVEAETLETLENGFYSIGNNGEPIVRCKDCKYYSRADKRRFYRGSDCLNHHIDTIVPDKDYCSKGERREE